VYGKIKEAGEATSYAPEAKGVVSRHVVEGNKVCWGGLYIYIYIYIYIGFINTNMYICIYIYIYPIIYSCVNIRVYNCIIVYNNMHVTLIG